MSKMDIHFSSEDKACGTPDDFFQSLNDIFMFDMDVAANEDNAKLAEFISPEEDTFKTPWRGTCFMNPPYGNREKACPKDTSKCKKKACKKRGRHITEDIPGVGDFVNLAVERSEDIDVHQVVLLLPARVDTAWFQPVFSHAKLILFVSGRLSFTMANGATDPAPFPSAVAVFGECPPESVFEELTKFGNVINPKEGGIMVYTKEED